MAIQKGCSGLGWQSLSWCGGRGSESCKGRESLCCDKGKLLDFLNAFPRQFHRLQMCSSIFLGEVAQTTNTSTCLPFRGVEAISTHVYVLSHSCPCFLYDFFHECVVSAPTKLSVSAVCIYCAAWQEEWANPFFLNKTWVMEMSAACEVHTLKLFTPACPCALTKHCWAQDRRRTGAKACLCSCGFVHDFALLQVFS